MLKDNNGLGKRLSVVAIAVLQALAICVLSKSKGLIKIPLKKYGYISFVCAWLGKPKTDRLTSYKTPDI